VQAATSGRRRPRLNFCYEENLSYENFKLKQIKFYFISSELFNRHLLFKDELQKLLIYSKSQYPYFLSKKKMSNSAFIEECVMKD